MAAVVGWIVSVLNSAFFVGLLSACAGAFAGAVGAQRIADRSKRTSDLLRELRSTNSAITLAFSICNGVLSLKKQHVAPMFDTYSKQKKSALEAMNMAKDGRGPTVYMLQADLKLFPAPEAPIESLKHLIFNDISAHGRILGLIVVLDQSITGLKESVAQRKLQAQDLQALDSNQRAFYETYLGIQNERGSTNQMYSDTVEAIRSYTDDIAFFSALLTDDLILHGNKLREKMRPKFRNSAPRVSTVDYSKPRELGQIPPETEYLDWLRGFTDLKKPSSS